MAAQKKNNKEVLSEKGNSEGLQEDTAGTLKKVEEKVLYSWTCPARPFKTRNREFYVTLFAIVGIVSLILFVAEGFMPVVLLISLVFLFYVMSTVKPEDVEYKVTNLGIKVGDRGTSWNAMTRYWFTKRFDNELLVIETNILPGRLEVVVKPELEDELRKVLEEYINEEEVPASFLDKSANWFSKGMPGS